MFAKTTKHPTLYVAKFFNQHIQYRLRTTKEKPLSGMQTVLRPKWKIRMSIFFLDQDIQRKLIRKVKPDRGGSRGRV